MHGQKNILMQVNDIYRLEQIVKAVKVLPQPVLQCPLSPPLKCLPLKYLSAVFVSLLNPVPLTLQPRKAKCLPRTLARVLMFLNYIRGKYSVRITNDTPTTLAGDFCKFSPFLPYKVRREALNFTSNATYLNIFNSITRQCVTCITHSFFEQAGNTELVKYLRLCTTDIIFLHLFYSILVLPVRKIRTQKHLNIQ